jgi:hypothetical protein
MSRVHLVRLVGRHACQDRGGWSDSARSHQAGVSRRVDRSGDIERAPAKFTRRDGVALSGMEKGQLSGLPIPRHPWPLSHRSLVRRQLPPQARTVLGVRFCGAHRGAGVGGNG